MRRYSILVIGGLAAAACVRLAFWQLDRLKQRDALRATIQARQAMPPVDLVGQRSDTLLYRRAFATGSFDFGHQVVVVGRTIEGLPAVLVVTPLLLEDGAAILVERGWVPSPDAASVDLSVLAEPERATVRGVLLAPAGRRSEVADTTWPLIAPADDPRRLGSRFPYRLLPWVLRRTEAPGPLPDGLRTLAEPALDRGPHLSYAIQWFAFAVIALGGSVALAFRSGSNRREPNDPRSAGSAAS